MPDLPPAPIQTPLTGADGRISPVWVNWLQLLSSTAATGGGGGGSGTVTTAGAGLVLSGGGTTVDAVANADGSIVVNANDIQVGVISNAQHGDRGGGSLHADVVAAGASGFMTGAQATTLDHLDALSDALSVFPSNGVDDTADVQDRIDDAVALGKRGIHFGDGTWVFDCGALTDDSCLIEVPSNFRITGAGWGRSILSIVNTSQAAGTGGVSVFRTEFDARSVRFGPGLDFVGDNGTDPDGSDQTYVLNNENCMIDTWPGSIDSRDITITGVMFRQTWGFGIHDRGGNFRTVVMDCHALQCNGGFNTNSDYGDVSHCRFERSEGIEASGKYSVFANNVLKDCYGVGLSIGGAVGGTEQPGCIVVGNTVDGGTGTGYVFSDAFSNSVVSGNVARKCRLGGMLMYSSGATVVRNNIISFNVIDSNCVDPDVGVVVGFDCRDNSGGHSIFGNQFIDSGETGFAQEYGAKIDAPNCTVSGNTFDGTVVDCTFGSSATNTFIPPGTNRFVNNTQQFTAGASIAISKALGIASTDRVWEHRIWNATTGALRSLHAVDWAGKYWWGDGTNLEDTNLYRSAADTLKTDDALVVGTNLTVSTDLIKTDDANNRVGINEASPTRTFVVHGSDSGNGIQRIGNTHASGLSVLGFENNAGTNRLDIGYGNASSAFASEAYLRHYVDFKIYRDPTGSAAVLAATWGNSTGHLVFEPGGFLGLGIAPTFHVHASGTVGSNGHVSARFQNLSAAGNSQVAVGNSASAFAALEVRGASEGTANLPPAGYAVVRGNTSTGGVAIQAQGSGTDIEFWTNVGGTHATRAKMSAAGNLYVAGQTTITAFAGGGQANATALTSQVAFVTTVASASDSCKLLTAALGLKQVVFNLGANAVDIYPQTGGAIDALGTNNPYSLAAGASREFWGQSATQWRSR